MCIKFRIYICTKNEDTLLIVKEIKFINLKRTNPKSLWKFINLKKGKPFSKKRHKESLQNLKNIKVFYEVDSKIMIDGDEVIVHYICKDKWTLLPIARGGVIDQNFWLHAGVVDYNFLGYLMHFGGFYQYYQLHGGQVYLLAPYLFHKQWGMNLLGYYFSTLEPIDTFNPLEVSIYQVDRWQVEIFGIYHITFKQRLELGISYLDESYIKKDKNKAGANFLQQQKMIFKFWYTLDYIKYNNLLLKGISYKIRVEPVLNLPTQFDFVKIESEYKHFFSFLKKDTLALRVFTGISNKLNDEYPAFVVDSFINVRGAGNKIKRGSIEVTFNIEYRYLVYEHPWFALQLATFFDNAYLFSSISSRDEHSFFNFFGGGVRIAIPKVYSLLLLFDYAFNLDDPKHHGFLFKVGQFF